MTGPGYIMYVMRCRGAAPLLLFLLLLGARTPAGAQVDMERTPDHGAPYVSGALLGSTIFEVGYAHVYDARCDDGTGVYCLNNGFGFSLGLQPTGTLRLIPRLSWWMNRGLYTGVSLAYYTGAESGSAAALEPEFGAGLGGAMLFGRVSFLTGEVDGRTVGIGGGVRITL